MTTSLVTEILRIYYSAVLEVRSLEWVSVGPQDGVPSGGSEEDCPLALGNPQAPCLPWLTALFPPATPDQGLCWASAAISPASPSAPSDTVRDFCDDIPRLLFCFKVS